MDKDQVQAMTRLVTIALAIIGAAVVLFLVAVIVLAATRATGAAAQTVVAIDGDTILANGKTYRLVGFDTPETGERAKCAAERILGGMASARLQALIGKGNLELTEVRCSCVPGTQGTR